MVDLVSPVRYIRPMELTVDTGAIVGGVVGGVVGLLAILALLWFFCIRPRRRNNVAFDEKTVSWAILPSRIV